MLFRSDASVELDLAQLSERFGFTMRKGQAQAAPPAPAQQGIAAAA